jgi:hypothetical protein
LLACIAVAAMSLAAAGTAEAKAPAKGAISLYGLYFPASERFVLPYGQLFSSKACDGNRKFKLVGVKGPKSTTVDKGTTSRDGGLSAFVNGNDTAGLDDLVFIVAKTKACAKVTLSITETGREVAVNGAARAANSIVQFLDFSYLRTDGMFAGTVESASRKCVGNRKIELLLGNKVVDSTKSTGDGTWALHITKAEANTSRKLQAVVARTSACSGGKKTPTNLE